MELGGLEPPTSWVRSRQTLAPILAHLQGICLRSALRSAATISLNFRPFQPRPGQRRRSLARSVYRRAADRRGAQTCSRRRGPRMPRVSRTWTPRTTIFGQARITDRDGEALQSARVRRTLPNQFNPALWVHSRTVSATTEARWPKLRRPAGQATASAHACPRGTPIPASDCARASREGHVSRTRAAAPVEAFA